MQLENPCRMNTWWPLVREQVHLSTDGEHPYRLFAWPPPLQFSIRDNEVSMKFHYTITILCRSAIQCKSKWYHPTWFIEESSSYVGILSDASAQVVPCADIPVENIAEAAVYLVKESKVLFPTLSCYAGVVHYRKRLAEFKKKLHLCPLSWNLKGKF